MSTISRSNQSSATPTTSAAVQSVPDAPAATPWHNDDERRVVERALAMHREVTAIAAHAGHGRILDAAECAAVEAGRRFNRALLEDVLAARVAELEKKTPRCAPASAAGAARTRGRTSAPS